ncbi:glyoxalase superfamily protein [Roseibium sp.]|uniref:glyoxalase superfamily protein n=1 Tax=Roseibium sp. TaxID=1936156 RepID=UPI003A96D2FD
MTGSSQLPSIEDLKAQAKRLRSALSDADSPPPSHGQSLDLIARQYGFRDWNTLFAAKGNRAEKTLSLGARVKGTYLRQAFSGQIISATALAQSRTRVTILFDEPVDVVTFDSFSAFRHRVTVTLDADGRTSETTSDGRPHMTIA